MFVQNNITNVLESLGFHLKEIQIYLVLMELGPCLANTISKKTGISRSTVYSLLDSLKGKSIVSTFVSKGVTFFQAIKSEDLLSIYERKVSSLKEILPGLEAMSKYSPLKPKIQLFEGRDGLIKILDDTLTATDAHILMYSDVSKALSSIIHDYYPCYIAKRIQKGLLVKGIFCDTPESVKFKESSISELREVYLLPVDLFPFDNEIHIYDNKFSLISHVDNMGLIIESESIANTQKLIFNICWEFAKSLHGANPNLRCELT